MEKSRFAQIDAAMETAVEKGVFPGGVLLWARGEEIFYHKGFGISDLQVKTPVVGETVYDLASLTKPLATALAVVKLVEQGRVCLSSPISDILGQACETSKAPITVDMLLRHTSGLPAHREYFKTLPQKGGQQVLRRLLIDEPLVSEPGTAECYSDLGYMFLSWIVETLSGQRLDHFITKEVYSPLGLKRLGFLELGTEPPEWGRSAASTMDCPWRKTVLKAQVEDENAWAAGGVEGHAGLFGDAGTVHRLCCEIMAAITNGKTRVLDSRVIRSFVKPCPGRTRVAGFDTPSEENSSAGQFYSGSAIGHLGFTGTSFWMDPEGGLITILLTNRVHPSRKNMGIRKFRPIIHDLVFKAFKPLCP